MDCLPFPAYKRHLGFFALANLLIATTTAVARLPYHSSSVHKSWESRRLIRVHELAKELGWTSKQTISYLRDRGEYVTSPQSAVAEIVVRDIRRELAATPTLSTSADEDLSPTLYGHAAGSLDDGGGWRDALRRAQAESRRPQRGKNQEPLPGLVRALLDEVIVPRRGDDRVPGDGSDYFGYEVREAKKLHKEWVRGQLTGLPDDDPAVIEWIKLTRGERPDLAAELASAGITATEAGLRLGYGSRLDPLRDTIFGRYRNKQINRSEALSEVFQWRRTNKAS